MTESGPRSFVVRLDLGPVAVSVVTEAIGVRAAAYDPRLTTDGSSLELTLTITADDLWLAVLLALAAVTDAGIDVVRLGVGPTSTQWPTP